MNYDTTGYRIAQEQARKDGIAGIGILVFFCIYTLAMFAWGAAVQAHDQKLMQEARAKNWERVDHNIAIAEKRNGRR